MNLASRSKYLPNSIRFYLLETDAEFRKFALLDRWTPFQAACLIYGLLPKQMIDGEAEVGVLSDRPISNELIDDFAYKNEVVGADVIDLIKIILLNNRSKSVNAKKIIEWAVANGFVTPDSFFVVMVLGSSSAYVSLHEFELLQAENARLREKLDSASDGRGAHHQENRLAILGFAITELVLNLKQAPSGEKLLWGQEINSSAIANLLHGQRDGLGMPSEDVRGFSHRNLEEAMRDASRMMTKVKVKIKTSTDKK